MFWEEAWSVFAFRLTAKWANGVNYQNGLRLGGLQVHPLL